MASRSALEQQTASPARHARTLTGRPRGRRRAAAGGCRRTAPLSTSPPGQRPRVQTSGPGRSIPTGRVRERVSCSRWCCRSWGRRGRSRPAASGTPHCMHIGASAVADWRGQAPACRRLGDRRPASSGVADSIDGGSAAISVPCAGLDRPSRRRRPGSVGCSALVDGEDVELVPLLDATGSRRPGGGTGSRGSTWRSGSPGRRSCRPARTACW